MAEVRNYRLTGLLVMVTLAGAMSACGGSSGPAPAGAPAVSCTNYAIHAHGKYDNEVSVRVKVRNSTARAAQYAINVEMSASHPRHADAHLTEVTINGSAASGTSVELGHKMLTSDPVKRCRITKVSRS
jgi:hypothetical protein